MEDEDILFHTFQITISSPFAFLNYVSEMKDMLTSDQYVAVNVKAFFPEPSPSTPQFSIFIEKCVEFYKIIVRTSEDCDRFQRDVGDLFFTGGILDLDVKVMKIKKP